MSFSPRWVTPLFFLLLLLTGWWIVDDFGISWDEAIQRRHGRVSMDYAAEKLGLDHEKLEPEWHLEDYQWSNYGMVYQITASLLELGLGYEDSPYQYYRLRHVMNFGLFWLALLCFYRTLRLRFPEREWWPLLGTLLLLLTPRIFGHAFFNPKDHLLLVGYLVATYTLLRLLKIRTWGALLIHALASALALNTRLPALFIPLATVGLLLWEQFFHRPGDYRRLAWIVAYLPLTALLMIPFFPFLWADTAIRLVGAFSEMSDFVWGGFSRLFGEQFRANEVPAWYIPGWIVATTPVLYLLFLVVGFWAAARRCGVSIRGHRRLFAGFAGEADLTQVALSVGPVLVVILLGSNLYNGWRHLHFVYPGLAYLMLVGFDHGFTRWGRPRLVGGILALALLTSAIQIVRYHPHQYVYFNGLIRGEPLSIRFDMDYWGTSYRELFEQLAEATPEGEVALVRCPNWPCKDNIAALPPRYRGKVRHEGDWNRAEFAANNLIYLEEAYGLRDSTDYFANPFLTISPAGTTISGVYRLRAGGGN